MGHRARSTKGIGAGRWRPCECWRGACGTLAGRWRLGRDSDKQSCAHARAHARTHAHTRARSRTHTRTHTHQGTLHALSECWPAARPGLESPSAPAPGAGAGWQVHSRGIPCVCMHPCTCAGTAGTCTYVYRDVRVCGHGRARTWSGTCTYDVRDVHLLAQGRACACAIRRCSPLH